jgi:hypothetical protein
VLVKVKVKVAVGAGPAGLSFLLQDWVKTSIKAITVITTHF